MMMLGFGNGIIDFLGSLTMIVTMVLPFILLVWMGFFLYDRLNQGKLPE